MATAANIKVGQSELDQLCINSIRVLAIDAVQKANSGHPGLPMGMAPAAYVLFTRFLRFNPKDPKWYGRDRFVLSAGHGSALLYALLYLTGYAVSMDDLKQFRQLGSITPGHPENYLTPGVETTTGPLGQGFATGIGMAIAAKHMASRFERDGSGLFDHRIFAITSDGDMMEGISHEAASIAGHLGLGNVIYLYDDNHVTLDGPAPFSFSEDVCKRFEAYGWHTQGVDDGNDIAAIASAIQNACEVKDRPSLVRIRTTIGYGSPHRAGTSEAHGKALGPEEVKLTKEFYGWPVEPAFYVPDQALAEMRKAIARGRQFEDDWKSRFDAYAGKHPSEAGEFRTMLTGELPRGWDAEIPTFTPKDEMATRKSASLAEYAISKKVWGLFGGSADLSESTYTDLPDIPNFERGCYEGRNLKFGIREHAMCGILNGIAHNGGFIPYGSSFFCFTDYARGSIRLACLMGLHVIYVFTHDSIGLGEDGPTHQAVEQLTAVRAIPNMTLIRPGDANESAEAWRVAMLRKGPTMLVLCRQNVPTLDRNEMAPASGLRRGAYVLTETRGRTPDIILLATGSELSLAVGAKPQLESKGRAVRVVSIPSFEIFAEQDEAYRNSVLPPNVRKRLAIEAGSPLCWYKWIGLDGDTVAMTTFGASGPSKDVLKHFGFTVENVVAHAEKLLAR